jgi:hypothetical protein
LHDARAQFAWFACLVTFVSITQIHDRNFGQSTSGPVETRPAPSISIKPAAPPSPIPGDGGQSGRCRHRFIDEIGGGRPVCRCAPASIGDSNLGWANLDSHRFRHLVGLQNIVNNFVSGVIILFECPVRVGDIVEVRTLKGK